MNKYAKRSWKAKRPGATAFVARIETPDGTGVGVAHGNTLEEALANAKLMAAAPEMLTACQTALLVMPYKYREANEQLRQAIAKATGELTCDRAMDELGFGEERE